MDGDLDGNCRILEKHRNQKRTSHVSEKTILPPPPLVQATVKDQKLTEPTPSVAWTRVLLTRRNLRDTRVDMMYYSENQEGKHATTALLANRAALTQDTKYEHRAFQTQGIRQHTWHTVERLEKRTAKINGVKIDGTNAKCCLDIGVAWTKRGGGVLHRRFDSHFWLSSWRLDAMSRYSKQVGLRHIGP